MALTDDDKINIVRGQDKTFKIKFRTNNGDPFDLTANTELTVCLKNADNTVLTLTKTGGEVLVDGSPLLGVVEVTLTDPQTTLLKLGDKQDFEAQIDEGAIKRIIQLLQKLNISDKIC